MDRVQDQITRRNVLRGAATVAAGGALPALAACGAQSAGPAPTVGKAPVTLEVWYSGSGDANDALHKQQFDSFRAKHPNVTIDGQAGQASLDKLTAAVTGGTPPQLT